MQHMHVQSLGQEDGLQEEMAAGSSVLAWESPWMKEPGGLQSTGSQGVGHNWIHTSWEDTWLDREIGRTWNAVLGRWLKLGLKGWVEISSVNAETSRFSGHELGQTLGRWWGTQKTGMLESMGLQSWTQLGDWTTTKSRGEEFRWRKGILKCDSVSKKEQGFSEGKGRISGWWQEVAGDTLRKINKGQKTKDTPEPLRALRSQAKMWKQGAKGHICIWEDLIRKLLQKYRRGG